MYVLKCMSVHACMHAREDARTLGLLRYELDSKSLRVLWFRVRCFRALLEFGIAANKTVLLLSPIRAKRRK